jgi:DNA modification methylase
MTEGNVLYYGDNLDVLRRHIGDESVDLIYLDPPFNSNADYNILFSGHGEKAAAQVQAFTDTWTWDTDARRDYEEIVEAGRRVADTMRAFYTMLGGSDMMAYLARMSLRLVELHRVLKPTGSLYLHCDPTASHYLKLLLDSVFGPKHFRNEIVWQRTGAHNDPKRFGRVSDSILFYSKTAEFTFNPQYTEYEPEYVAERYKYDDGDGRKHWRNTMTAAGPGPARLFRGIKREPPPGTHWRFSQAEIDRTEAEGRIYYSPSGMPYVKSYLDEQRQGRPEHLDRHRHVQVGSGAPRLSNAEAACTARADHRGELECRGHGARSVLRLRHNRRCRPGAGPPLAWHRRHTPCRRPDKAPTGRPLRTRDC